MQRDWKSAKKHRHRYVAVDFVLLDENDEMLGNAVAYRDDRTDGYMEKAFQVIPQDMLYLYTGIQF